MSLLAIAALAWSADASAQGDILGSNRDRPTRSEARAQPREVPADRPYVPDPDGELRMVRLLGENVVYRLERWGDHHRVYRDMSQIPVVVCAEPPCDVWLPYEAALAVQLEGRSYALGRLTLPPGPGVLSTAISRGRRIVAGVLMVATFVAGAALFAAGAREDPDGFLNFQPVFYGLGAALVLGGVLTGGILLAMPRRGVARWQPLGAGRGWH